jgi:nucleoside-diphosphate kinase
MATQRTLCIIKPDAVEKGRAGAILARILEEGFNVRALKQIHLTLQQAEGFYAVHRGRAFFADLTRFMSRSPVVVIALEHEQAVQRWRDVIGATDPTKAAEGTIRKHHGSDVGENAVHGSDSEANGRIECSYFFAELEML